jgi:hypothetical protein
MGTLARNVAWTFPDCRHRGFQAGLLIEGERLTFRSKLLRVHKQDPVGRALACRSLLDRGRNPAVPEKIVQGFTQLGPAIRMPRLGIIVVHVFCYVDHAGPPMQAGYSRRIFMPPLTSRITPVVWARMGGSRGPLNREPGKVSTSMVLGFVKDLETLTLWGWE